MCGCCWNVSLGAIQYRRIGARVTPPRRTASDCSLMQWHRGFALLSLLSPWIAQAVPPGTGSAVYGDWHDDAPGVVRRITPDSMPVPYLSTSAHRAPSVVP